MHGHIDSGVGIIEYQTGVSTLLEDKVGGDDPQFRNFVDCTKREHNNVPAVCPLHEFTENKYIIMSVRGITTMSKLSV